MKAMVFAAGVGSRLKELTRDTPKCLMTVSRHTMLELVVERLKAIGVSSIAINIHHHAEKVVAFVKSKDNFGINIIFSHEQTLLDTGGGLKKLQHFFEGEDAFIIHNSDIFSSCDLQALVTEHRAHKAIGTLAVMENGSPRGLFFDSKDILVGWTQEGQSAHPGCRSLGFSGISVASGELFAFMGAEETFSLIKPYLQASRATHRVRGALIPLEDWVDIGTPDQLAALRHKLC